ncbi:MAG: helix-turn-helix domain-containing protein [Gemmatimonadota bacterium]
MYKIASQTARVVREARQHSYLSQQQLADAMGTSQSTIAKLERGEGNPTIETLARCAAAVGMVVRVEFVPAAIRDPVVDRYKHDVDRTLLRENLRKSVGERVRTLGEWQDNVRELQRATKEARRRK